jgi:hypothetical protein
MEREHKKLGCYVAINPEQSDAERVILDTLTRLGVESLQARKALIPMHTWIEAIDLLVRYYADVVLTDFTNYDNMALAAAILGIVHRKHWLFFVRTGHEIPTVLSSYLPHHYYESLTELDSSVEREIMRYIQLAEPKEPSRKSYTTRAAIPPKSKKRTIDDIEGHRKQRVFIGGSYHTHLSTLIEMRNHIRDKTSFVPILAQDYQMPKDKTHQYSLILLHNCKYAIFEVSSPAGQLMELERSRDYEMKTLVLYNASDPKIDPKHVTSMVKSYGAVCKSYSSMDELRAIVEAQLSGWATEEWERD